MAAQRAALPPNIARLARGGVTFARHYTASNDCTPARAALLTGLYTHQTGCMITGGEHARPGLPDLGHDAARAGLLAPTGTASGTSPTATTHWNAVDGPGGARALRLRRRHLPLAQRRARPGLARRPDDRRRSSSTGSTQADGRRAVVHDGLVRQPARHRVVVALEPTRPRRRRSAPGAVARAAAELRDARAADRAPQAVGCSCSLQDTSAASFGAVPFTGPGVTAAWLPFLDLYVKLQREVDRQVGARAAHARRAAPRWPRTRSSCSPPTTASTAPRTACAARARASTRRRSACR